MPGRMRLGSWMQTPDGVGVLTGLNLDKGLFEIDLVDDDGLTTTSQTYAIGTIGQASNDAIPASRRTPPRAKLSEPISEEENEAKNRAIAAGTFQEP